MAWYRTGGCGDIPASLITDMNAVLNKKMGTSTTYPWSQWAGTVNLMGKLPERTVSGAVASFQDGADDVPLKSIVVTISPNFDGKTTVTVSHSGEDTENPTEYNIALGRTVYGGHIDIISGLLTVEYMGFVLDALTWQGGNVGQSYCWNTNLPGNNLKIPENGSVFDGACDTYTPIRFNGVSANINTIALRNTGVLYVNNNSTTISPTGHVTIALATPIAYQLSTNEINSLYGVNKIWNDAGNTEVTYRRDIELALANQPSLMMMSRPPIQEEESTDESI